MKLPNSKTIELSATTTATITALSSSVTSIITVANLTGDFASSTIDRQVLFKHLKITCSPINYLPTTYSTGVTAQLFMNSNNGAANYTVSLTKQRMLSKTNTTVLSVRIPEWLVGTFPVTSGQTVFYMIFTTASNATVPVATTVQIPYNIVAMADISVDIPTQF